ncbi:beta-galactosidase [Echinimonas agarilytica]|uniref:Beta-galactosidase n=1 Tax=Echinimonas agarilytica TaxID=1215918 RepID=A0AA42B7L7_9GAMM|nr:beta-galactosidase [Echinimonas agarilytica]MCM2679764.1 beta-galactosidase [Echinimonas agarilytica]
MRESKFLNLPLVLLSSIVCPFITSCGAVTDSEDKQLSQVRVTDFESAHIPSFIEAFNADITLVKNGVDSQGLQVSFSNSHASSGINLVPSAPWNTSELGNNALMFDIQNTGVTPVMLSTNVKGLSDAVQRRTIGLDVGEKTTLYFELKGLDLNVDTGLRDTPPTFDSPARKMILRGGKVNADFSDVYDISIYTETQINLTQVVLDNVRFETTPTPNADYLNKIVDAYGQRNDVEFDLKVTSDAQLKARADEELKQLAQSKGWPERSKFGGWRSGPKLNATGYFRTEKVSGQWAMVDPQGYLFFSSGIANARMANTSTFTGVDYKDDSVRYIDPNDVTPEDSQAIGGNYTKAQKTAYIANEQRHNMFEWLPDYNSPLAEHYGYRRESHMGPIEHGEVFSFYQANLERRYGESSPKSYIDQWRQVTLDRMNDWGFTSFGNWTDASFYNNNQVPYFANGWIIGDFKTLSSGFDYWGAMPDPFDQEFVRRAHITTAVIAEEVQNNPWCIGVFIDNEMSWGGQGKPIQRYGIVFDALTKTPSDSPTKDVFSQMLKDKYGNIDALATAWHRDINSWAELDNGLDYKMDTEFSEAMLSDFSWLLERYADEYFKVVKQAVADVLPNHMYMGARFTSWGTSPEARWSAKKYADVISYNYYREGLDQVTWGFLEELDMPTIIGEFHIGSTDTGQPNPGIIHAPNQKTRADMYETYMDTVIDNPYLVGAHWFQYIDSPITGRAHDGENYNVGFVTTTDIPYPHLIKSAKKVHQSLYQRRYGQQAPQK